MRSKIHRFYDVPENQQAEICINNTPTAQLKLLPDVSAPKTQSICVFGPQELTRVKEKRSFWAAALPPRVKYTIRITVVFLSLAFTSCTVRIRTQKIRMEQRLSVITFGADNLNGLKEFYEEKFGWKPIAENKDIVFFKLNGFLLSFYGKKELAAGAGVKPGDGGFKSITLAYNVGSKKEVDQLYERLKAKSIEFLKTPQLTPFGAYFFTISDPEGNVIEIAYNPYIPLDGDGNTITHKNINNL